MKHLSFGRVSQISIMLAVVFSLTACFGGGDKEDTKTDKSSGKWEVPTGADPQY